MTRGKEVARPYFFVYFETLISPDLRIVVFSVSFFALSFVAIFKSFLNFLQTNYMYFAAAFPLRPSQATA